MTSIGTLTAADGTLPADVVNNVSITVKNKATNAPATDKDFKLKLDAKKGGLTGSFTHTDLSKPKFTGIVFQKGPLQSGNGYFLSTVPKGAHTGESGGITLLAKQRKITHKPPHCGWHSATVFCLGAMSIAQSNQRRSGEISTRRPLRQHR